VWLMLTKVAVLVLGRLKLGLGQHAGQLPSRMCLRRERQRGQEAPPRVHCTSFIGRSKTAFLAE
jgi:hypothetical protein